MPKPAPVIAEFTWYANTGEKFALDAFKDSEGMSLRLTDFSGVHIGTILAVEISPDGLSAKIKLGDWQES